MDPRICCSLGACCPPGSIEQEEALAALIREQIESDPDALDCDLKAARLVLKLFGTEHKARYDELLAAEA